MIGLHRLRKTLGVFGASVLLVCVLIPTSAYAESVSLSWNPNPEPDVAGYNIYRSDQSEAFSSVALNGNSLVQQTNFTDSTAQSNRIYYYAVTAVASSGQEGARSVAVQAIVGVLPTNQAPLVSAGQDQTVILPDAAILTAAANDDRLPANALTYRWSVVRGSGVLLRTPEAAITQAVFAAPGVYTLRITVSDGEFSSTDDVRVTVDQALTAGFLGISPGIGTATPAGLALVGFYHDGALVSEAAFQAAPAIESGRIHAEIQDSLNTGIAIANPNNEEVALDFYFVDGAGVTLYTGRVVMPGNGRLSAFLSEPPFAPPAEVRLTDVRTFTFSASLPIAITAVRAFTNERSDFLMTPLAIADIHHPKTAAVTFPYYLDGAGWQSDLQLVNPTDSVLSGVVQFYPSLNGSGSDPDFTYEIPPRSAVAIHTPGLGQQTRSGWVRVSPQTGKPIPSGSLILTFRSDGVTLSQAAMHAPQEAKLSYVYAETSGLGQGSPGSVQTGVAINNLLSTPARIDLELFNLDGRTTGRQGTLTVGANSNLTMFLDQIPGMQGMETSLKGFLRIEGAPSVIVGLKRRYIEGGNAVIAPIPAVAKTAAPTPEKMFLFFTYGRGYATQVIDFNASGNIVLP